MKRTTQGVCVLCTWLLALPVTAWAEQDEPDSAYPPSEQSTQDLAVLPESEQYEVHKEHAGGRLERVTITWDNGITEVYHNKRADSLWASEETELGGAQNVRQWKLFNW